MTVHLRPFAAPTVEESQRIVRVYLFVRKFDGLIAR